MKKSALILLVAFATLSFTSSENLMLVEEDTGCETVFTICNRAFPENYANFYQCMRNNGCSVDETGED